MPYIFNRAYGALVGQACGDALGCRYKFRSADDVKEQISADRDDDTYFLPIRGSAVFEFPPGQVNDGTEYCMLIARSLSRQGCVDFSDIGKSILRWKQSDPIATHNPVFEAADLETENEDPQISSNNNGGQIEKKITLSALLKNKSCLSNMCLSIATPIAISTATRLNDSMTLSLSSKLTKLTQPHPAAQDAVRVLAAAIRSLILCPDPQIAYEVALKSAKTSIVLEHLEDARKRPHPYPEVEQENDGSGSIENEIPIDYLGITLQIAFYHLLYAESFYDGVISSISLGGDTTANAAITGALLGARFGAQSIPQQWKNTVEDAKLERHIVFPDVYLSDAQILVNRLLYKLSF
jgi:ADP-ribosyl-[dinitrogen reductase] hydrolase